MSIMREKPIICTDWFDVPTLTNMIDGKEVDILSFVNTGKFFEDVCNDLSTSWTLTVQTVSRNDRTYPDTIWNFLNPFKYPRFRLFQIENSSLFCKDLIK